MECGIFALLGVVLGAAAAELKNFKTVTKRKSAAVKNESEEGLSLTQQWENLLNYDGKKQ